MITRPAIAFAAIQCGIFGVIYALSGLPAWIAGSAIFCACILGLVAVNVPSDSK